MDITFKCERCGQSLVVDAAGAGEVVPCPACGHSLTIPRPSAQAPSPVPVSRTPPVTTETKKCPFCAEEIRKDAIKCKHCGEFLNGTGIPRRQSTVSPSSVDTPTPAPAPPTRGYSLPGIVEPEASRYAESLIAAYQHITSCERGISSDPLARLSLDALKRIQANINVGITPDTYAALLAEASLPIEDFVRTRPQYPRFGEWLKGTQQAHANILATWRATPAQTGSRFWGGGFGLWAFLIGFLSSMFANAVMDSGDKQRQDELTRRLQAGWVFTAANLNMLEDAMNPSSVRQATNAIELTPLKSAAVLGEKDVAKDLIAKGADVNAKDVVGQTPLYHAASQGHKDMAELLIANGADVNTKDISGATPLDIAALSGHKNVAELLIANGADVNTKDINGTTPLDSAALQGHKDVVELLLAKGADVNAKAKSGGTPLLYAALKGYKDVAELLIAKGADVNAKASKADDEHTPLTLAAAKGHDGLVELLKAHGAR